MQIRVVQSKEPDHFLLVFKGRMVVHSGGRASSFKNRCGGRWPVGGGGGGVRRQEAALMSPHPQGRLGQLRCGRHAAVPRARDQ